MLDVGWQELLLIGVVAIIFIGPQELPRVMRSVMGVIRKARSIAGEFHEAVNEAARQADMDDVKKQLIEAGTISPTELLERGFDPGGEMKKEFAALSAEVKEVGYVPPLEEPAPPQIEQQPYDPYGPGQISQPPMDSPEPATAETAPETAPETASEIPRDRPSRTLDHG